MSTPEVVFDTLRLTTHLDLEELADRLHRLALSLSRATRAAHRARIEGGRAPQLCVRVQGGIFDKDMPQHVYDMVLGLAVLLPGVRFLTSEDSPNEAERVALDPQSGMLAWEMARQMVKALPSDEAPPVPDEVEWPLSNVWLVENVPWPMLVEAPVKLPHPYQGPDIERYRASVVFLRAAERVADRAQANLDDFMREVERIAAEADRRARTPRLVATDDDDGSSGDPGDEYEYDEEEEDYSE